MKKLLSIIFGVIIAVFALPLITIGFFPNEEQDKDHKPPQNQEDVMVENEKDDGLDVDKPAPGVYDGKTMVKVLLDGGVQTMTMHDYLVGVLAAEMPAAFPEEALKAQAVAARTYTEYKMNYYAENPTAMGEHKGAQVCTDPKHCKAYTDIAASGDTLWGEDKKLYQGKIEAAVSSTDGVIATYNDQPIVAVFHAVSSEKTECASDVWAGDQPYLVSVDSPGGEAAAKYHGTVTVKQKDFKAAVLAEEPSAKLDGDAASWFMNSDRSDAGGVKSVYLGGVKVSGAFVRKTAGLNSTNFRVAVLGDKLVFTTTGHGHGVGMSQYGARALALGGKTYEEIIKHYYTGVALKYQ